MDITGTPVWSEAPVNKQNGKEFADDSALNTLNPEDRQGLVWGGLKYWFVMGP